MSYRIWLHMPLLHRPICLFTTILSNNKKTTKKIRRNKKQQKSGGCYKKENGLVTIMFHRCTSRSNIVAVLHCWPSCPPLLHFPEQCRKCAPLLALLAPNDGGTVVYSTRLHMPLLHHPIFAFTILIAKHAKGKQYKNEDKNIKLCGNGKNMDIIMHHCCISRGNAIAVIHCSNMFYPASKQQ